MTKTNTNGQRAKRLLVSYAWSVNNIGDIGITPGLISLIRKAMPDLPISVITTQVASDPAYRYWETFLAENFEKCDTLPNPFKERMGATCGFAPASAWGRFYTRWGKPKLDAFIKGCLASDLSADIAEDLLNRFPSELIEEWREQSPESLAAFENAGFVLFNSGTVFNFGRLQVRDLWTYALHFAMPLIIARHLGIPYGINGHSYDAIDWPADLIFRPLFKDARFVFSRDSDSANYLRQRDLNNDVEGYRPDSTFFYESLDEEWAQAFMERHRLAPRRFITLTTRHPARKLDASSDWDKVGGDPVAGSVGFDRQEEQMQKLRDFIEAWVEQTGMPIVMALEARLTEQLMKEWLLPGLSEKARAACIWLDEFWNTEQAYSVYRRARIAVSMEMHTVIMAIQAGTPTVHIPFREAGRKARMLKDVGLGDWLLDIDEISSGDLLDTCLEIDRDFDESLDRIDKAMAWINELGNDVVQRTAANLK